MTIDRDATVREQLAEAEQQRRNYEATVEELKDKIASLCNDMQLLDNHVFMLKQYQARHAPGAGAATQGGKPAGHGIRSITQAFIRTRAEFTYDELLAEVMKTIPQPNVNSIRAELSHNKRSGKIDKKGPGRYVSLVAAPHHGTYFQRASTSYDLVNPDMDPNEMDRKLREGSIEGSLSVDPPTRVAPIFSDLMKSQDWSKVPDGPPAGSAEIDQSDPSADQ